MAKDSPRAKKITETITEFIALDDQPFSVVDDMGFRRLLEVLEPRYEPPSRRHITDVMLPRVFDTVKAHVQSSVADVESLSFTTDIWSSSLCPMSLLSLTAQWIDEKFDRHQVMLQTRPFRGHHTSLAIANIFTDMLQLWGIKTTATHVVVHDNARNMVRGMSDAGLASLCCVAHTLQLVVHEGLLSQRSVGDAVAVERRIVGQFKKSTLAYSKLEDIQLSINQPSRQLQQDVPTRWNSTLYMIQSLLDQKWALGIYASENEVDTLSANQWALLEKTAKVLAPFEELTRRVSSSTATAADIISAITVLLRFLSRETDEDQGVRTMKGTLLAAVKARFGDSESNPNYTLATLLDPR